mgnify:CR=1 FL=1
MAAAVLQAMGSSPIIDWKQIYVCFNKSHIETVSTAQHLATYLLCLIRF